MEGTSLETIDNAIEMEATDTVETNLEVENGGSSNENQQQRQDFTSESYKIELNNMGKFSFGVCILYSC